MAKTSIEWADYTFNHIRGCTEVSPACDHCYAREMSKRNPATLGIWGREGMGRRVVAAEAYWRTPLKWNQLAEREQVRRRVFCASLADVYEDWQGPMANVQGGRLAETMDDVRGRLFSLIEATPSLDWLLLTKRPENIERMMNAVSHGGDPDEGTAWDELRGGRLKNLWIGCTVENQEMADLRIPLLLQIPATVRFLSCEPLLGPVDLKRYLGFAHQDELGILNPDPKPDPWGPLGLPMRDPWIKGIGWVIAGGESGPNARPSRPDWFRSLRDQCQSAKVPYLFKQWGEWAEPHQLDETSEAEITKMHTKLWSEFPQFHFDIGPRSVLTVCRVGKKAAGRQLDGREWNEFPSAAGGF